MTRAAARRAALAAVLALAVAPGVSWADAVAAAEPAAEPTAAATAVAAPAEPPPDPSAIEAGEANLESSWPRKGYIFTFGAGGGLSVGFGMKNATGQGGAGTARLAYTATRRTVIAVEIVGAALFFKVGKDEGLYRMDATNFLAAAQYYVNPALWLRGGVGVGRFAGEEYVENGLVLRPRVRFAGPAASAGAGVDIVRLKRVRLSVEFSSTALLNRAGILSSNGFLIGLSVD